MRRIIQVALVTGAMALTMATSACGGGPCGKSVEATAKYATGEEKKMAAENKDAFIKACEMGLKGDPAMQKMVECQGNATDEKSFNECRKM